MSRSIRLLNLLQLLREYRYPVTAQVLAERLQISQRSVCIEILKVCASKGSILMLPQG